jgi:hypothetical protein
MHTDFRLEPGKWYVSVPSSHHRGNKPAGGPFDTEEEARDWLRCMLIRGAIVWQCHDTGGHGPRTNA